MTKRRPGCWPAAGIWRCWRTTRSSGDRPVTLSIAQALVNGAPIDTENSYYFRSERFVAPGAETLTFVALGVNDGLPEGLAVDEIRLGMTCADDAEVAWATLRFPPGAALSTPDGLILSAEELAIEPAAF